MGPSLRLTEEDASRYAQIFALQDTGSFKQAAAETTKVKDTRLMGHVLAQRYLHPDYPATRAELAGWLKAYADHPPAQKIYDLAQRKKGVEPLSPPKTAFRGISGQYDFDVIQVSEPLPAEARSATSPGRNWNAGLNLFKQGDYAKAAAAFEQTANAARASGWMASAGAYWAARSYLRAEQPDKVSPWLERAANYPRTFYGIIALKALGREQSSFNWNVPELTDKHIRAISAVPAGKRALALLDAERPDLAETELKRVNPGNDPLLREAMVSLSSRGMPALSLRLGGAFKTTDGKLYDAALYPDVPWEPVKGFDVDRALVYAFIRQESQYSPGVRNRSSGAEGLMQLMPRTAEHVARAHGRKIDRSQLKDPVVNIDLGQKYLDELLQHGTVEKNLFKLAVAYNAGPGKLARLQRPSAKDDPLLFIETFPVAETRNFVERVLTNYWIYRIKFNQSARSLDDVARGDWPIYLAQDKARSRTFAASETFFAQ